MSKGHKLAPKWTANDQQLLDELTARRQAFHTTHGDVVVSMIKRTWPSIAGTASKVANVTTWLLDNVDEIRDALEPFDSGVRPADTDMPAEVG